MNYNGIIKVIYKKDTKYCTLYKFNADMYLNQIIEFFKENNKEEILKIFNNLKYINVKQYNEYVKLSGLYDDYDFDECLWKSQDGNKKFNMVYQELDNRCFINLFTGKNDFEILLETNRNYVLDNKSSFSNNIDFKYIINLDEWKLGVNSLYYDSKVIDI